MAIDRIYYKEQNFLLTIIYDQLSDLELIEHVHAINNEYQNIDGLKELADCRYLFDVSQLTARDMLTTADSEKGTAIGAIIAESDVIFGLASMYAAIASNIREESKAYRTLDEGIEALCIGDFKSVLEDELSRSSYEKRFKALKKSIPE